MNCSVSFAYRFASKTIVEHTESTCRQSVKQNGYLCHVYVRADNLAAVLISDDEYPQRVAHTLITTVLDDFITKVHSESLPSATESSINFTALTTYLHTYQDPRKADKLTKIQSDLDETKIVLKQSIDSVLTRGEKLDDLIEKSDKLSSQSKTFYRTAKKTNSCCSFS